MAYDLRATIKLADEFSNPLKNAIRTMDNIERVVNQVSGNFDNMTRNVRTASDEMNRLGDMANNSNSDVARLEQEMEQMRQELDRATREAGDLENNLSDAGNAGAGAGDKIGGAFKVAAGIIASVLAVDQIKDFTKGLIEAAADATAMNAQYDQVFGDIKGTATDTINAMSKEFNIVPNRLKPAMTSMTSMFQGLGLEGPAALEAAERGIRMASDAAAFFDVELSDANGSLNSFIKGNYEGGEAIGLYGKESQLAAYSAKTLGEDWKTLDEAGKQLVRMTFAEEMMKNAKITGQAAKESEGYQNVVANMQQAWLDLKGVVGIPIMETAIEGMGRLAGWLEKIDGQKIADGLAAAQVYLSDTFSPLLGKVTEDVKGVWAVLGDGVENGLEAAFESVQTGMQWVADNWQLVKDGVVALTAAFVAYHAALKTVLIIQTINKLMLLYHSGLLITTAQQWLLNSAMLANPIGLVAVAIGALVGAGVLLYKNWDTVREKTQQLWGKLKDFGAIAKVIMGNVGEIIGTAIDMGKEWLNLGGIWDSVWSGIKSAAESSINSVIEKINGLIEVINAIPGVNIPIIAKVDWTQADRAASSSVMGAMSYAEAVNGSHATGLASVPHDNYLANLHANESVLTASQSNLLRSMGVLKSAGDKPVLDASALSGKRTGTGQTINTGGKTGVSLQFGNVVVNGHNKPTVEIASEILDNIKAAISNGALAGDH